MSKKKESKKTIKEVVLHNKELQKKLNKLEKRLGKLEKNNKLVKDKSTKKKEVETKKVTKAIKADKKRAKIDAKQKRLEKKDAIKEQRKKDRLAESPSEAVPEVLTNTESNIDSVCELNSEKSPELIKAEFKTPTVTIVENTRPAPVAIKETKEDEPRITSITIESDPTEKLRQQMKNQTLFNLMTTGRRKGRKKRK